MVNKNTDQTLQQVRLDRWLWAARFYKTRAMATEAVNGGKVHVNGARAKASKLIHPDYTLAVSKGPYVFEIVVRELRDRRVSAPLARQMYEETESSVQQREKTRLSIKSQPTIEFHSRPSKKERRQSLRVKREPNRF